MPELATLTVVGVVVLAVLVIVFLKLRQKDLLGALMDKRKAGAKIVSRADYVEGAETIPVVLSLTADMLYYENPDMEASFELSRIDEIEYAEDLATGKSVPADCRVLRLRSHGTTFEFEMEKSEVQKWQAALPTRTLGAVARAV